MAQVITGPVWAARNWSADEGEGSIHDDATAAKLGFRGGTCLLYTSDAADD